ncbi:YczE/YyaS/YitT family protein [Enterococcus asini]|uniref:YczE/YyaS/YitT family protein n=1 Tax=Enterococcus asini TaxID=57732 RepID=UPI00241C8D9B|nr:DUF6198 family protein [Enterococcus asini]
MLRDCFLPKRLAIYCTGLLILALGTALFPLSRLGSGAIVALPVVLSHFTNLTLGQGSFCLFCLFIFLQILLEKKLRLKTLLQLPFSLVFGTLVDFYSLTLGLAAWQPEAWPVRLFLVVAAICATSLGALLMVKGDIILNAPDGFVVQLAKKWQKSFGQTKLVVDGVLLAVAALLGLVFTGSLTGLGIASFIAVYSVGRLIQHLDQRLFIKKGIREKA